MMADQSDALSHFSFDDIPYVPWLMVTDVTTGACRGVDVESDVLVRFDESTQASASTAAERN